MSRRRWIAALAACLLLLPAATPAAADQAEAPEISARGAALYEVSTGRLLYEHNGDDRLPMASTTKVMTALLALESGDLSAQVCVPDEAVGMEGSSIYLARDETMQLRDLLYGLMLSSGNDAAVSIAAHLGGTQEAFAERMNERAAEMGCTNTHFVNPNGLPNDAHYTTAADLGLIAAHAMRNGAFREIVSTSYYRAESGDIARTFKNKNKLLWQYEGGNGVKTGFTKAAGRCLVFSAEREGMTLVGALLNAPDMWNDAAKLLDFGFASIENVRLADAERPLGYVQVTGAVQKELAVYPKYDILYPLARDGSDTLAWKLELANTLAAPVQAGCAAGTLTLFVNGDAALETPMIVTESVPAARLGDRLRQIAADWTT